MYGMYVTVNCSWIDNMRKWFPSIAITNCSAQWWEENLRSFYFENVQWGGDTIIRALADVYRAKTTSLSCRIPTPWNAINEQEMKSSLIRFFLFQKQQKNRKNKKIFRIIYPNTRVCWLGCHIFPAIIIFQLERTHVQVEIKERKKQGGEVIWNNSIQIVRALIQLSFWYTLPFCWNHNKVVVLIHIRYLMLSTWH